MDDLNEFAYLSAKSIWGTFNYTNSTYEQSKDVFGYNPATNQIQIKFSSYQDIVDSAGDRVVLITIADKRGKFSTYRVHVVF